MEAVVILPIDQIDRSLQLRQVGVSLMEQVRLGQFAERLSFLLLR